MRLPTEQRYLRSYRHIVRSVTGAGQLQINHHLPQPPETTKYWTLQSTKQLSFYGLTLSQPGPYISIYLNNKVICVLMGFLWYLSGRYRFISSYSLFNSVYRGQSIQLLPVKFYDLYLEYIIIILFEIIQLNQSQSIAVSTLLCIWWPLIE